MREEIFANYISNNDVYPAYLKNTGFNIKTLNSPLLKPAKELDRRFPKRLYKWKLRTWKSLHHHEEIWKYSFKL